MPFEDLEEKGVTIPVLGVNVTYKHHVTFGDTITIDVFVKEYNGVRMTIRIWCKRTRNRENSNNCRNKTLFHR